MDSRSATWREYALTALQDARTVRRFGGDDGPEKAEQILRAAEYVLRSHTTPPSIDPPRNYSDGPYLVVGGAYLTGGGAR